MRIERALVGLLFTASAIAGGCGKLAYNLPPASRIMEPGPGVGGPGPGVIPPAGSPYGMYGGGVNRFGGGMGAGMGMGGPCAQMGPQMGPGPMMGPGGPNGGDFQPHSAHRDVMPASFNGPSDCAGGSCACGPGGGGGPGMNAGAIQQAGFHGALLHGGGPRCMGPGSSEAYADGSGAGGMATSQIAFLGDNGVQVTWDVSGAGMFDSTALVIPGRQDFYQGAIYRLKLSAIPGRAGVQLYPTLEVAPVTPRTDAYLAHAPIPVQFTEEDFDQVISGNFVTKVIYLPDPEFQELALAGVETLVSTRLDPGVDPIAEADRRGSILAIVRIGSKDLELNGGASGQSGQIVPASLQEPAPKSWQAGLQRQQQQKRLASKNVSASKQSSKSDIATAQYSDSEQPVSEGQPIVEGQVVGEGAPISEGQPQYSPSESVEGFSGGAPCTSGGYTAGSGGACYGNGAMVNMPMGMPTGGFAPNPVPPNMVAGAPEWGMPITGTPIGLPGPPHIPLGTPAGLQQHVIKNKTKVKLPPPVTKMEMFVKERPGQNYPRPVDHVHVDEIQREPVHLLPTWMTGAFGHGHGNGGFGGSNCEPYPQ